MTNKLPLAAVVLLSALTALAETSGAPFPLTNTRYGIEGGDQAVLRTNGSDAVVFWVNGRGDVRATRVVEGQNRAGEMIFEESSAFDATWTGTHFLAVRHRYEGLGADVIGRLLDADGRPAGPLFVILGGAHDARLAAGHGVVLMVYQATSGQTRAVLLTPDGRAATTSTLVAPTHARHAVAATAGGFAVVTSSTEGITATSLDAQARIVAQQTISRPGIVDFTVASQGTRSLVVWSTIEKLEAAILDQSGTFGAPLLVDDTAPGPLDPIYPGTASAVWNVNGWTVAYQAGRQRPRLRVAHLDPLAQRVVTREESPVGMQNPSLAVAGGKILATWSSYGTAFIEPVWIGALPLAANAGRPVTFGAAFQGLTATASSAEGMLAVWLETIDQRIAIRTGVRTHTGHWSEQEIATSRASYQMVAASDGRAFVLCATFDATRTSEAIFLDESGRPTGLRVALPAPVEAVAWNGRHYALIDDNGDARLLSPDGTLSAPVPLGVRWAEVDLATNGDGFLLTGGTRFCPFILCYAGDTRALRLDANLQRVGAELLLAPQDGWPIDVVWNGTDYVVVWVDRTGTGFSRVSPAPGVEPQTRHVTMTGDVAAIAPAGGGGVAVLRLRIDAREVLFFSPDGSLRTSTTMADNGFPVGGIDLVPLAGDDLAYVTTRILPDAPHYGARRVTMAVVAGSRIAWPAAPHLAVREENGRFLVEWSAPPGTVNGYRLEYRIDDGAWIELERWFGPGDTSIGIRRPSFGSTFVFRVRAFNDSGAGAYSNIGNPNVRKRRAAR